MQAVQASSPNDHAPESSEQKVKKYFRVFYALFFITVAEVSVVYMPMSKMLISVIVVALACTKAAMVGYYYMHLEHETKWLRMVACLPIIAFGYAVFLVMDAPKRPPSIYSPEAVRVYKGEAAEEAEREKVGAIVTSEEATPPHVFGNLKASDTGPSTGSEAPPPNATTPSGGSGAPVGVSPAAPPAASGSDEWK